MNVRWQKERSVARKPVLPSTPFFKLVQVVPCKSLACRAKKGTLPFLGEHHPRI